MSAQTVKEFLAERGYADRFLDLAQLSATVSEAALALGCSEAQIAKTLSFVTAQGPVLIVAAGDAKVDNHKYKEYFHCKAVMCPRDQLEELIGHAAGGVCPFAVKDGVRVYLDESLRRFETVYPAAGNDHSALKLKLEELYTLSGALSYIDVCKLPAAAQN